MKLSNAFFYACLLFFVFIFPVVHNADAATIRVSGNTSAGIQAAFNSAASGDTVIIPSGSYNITSTIVLRGKDINVEGEGSATLNINVGTGGYGLVFTGTQISTPSLSADALRGASQITLNDASSIQSNDLIRIWKNVQWCPDDHPTQLTGETYLVQSVSGNTITLNQPLYRDYRLSETIETEIRRPIKVHINNIRVQGQGALESYRGVALVSCIDSSVTNSWFRDNGEIALALYTCFRTSASNNSIYNSSHPGNGYGIGVSDGSAFIDLTGNYIENCRHTIAGISSNYKGLNRDVYIADNTLRGGNVPSSQVIDSHPVTIDYTVVRNKIYPYPNSQNVAFADGTLHSLFADNEIHGGSGVVIRRGSINNGIHVIRNNTVEGSGYLYEGYRHGVGEMLIIENNTFNIGQHQYGVGFAGSGNSLESFRNIQISGNKFGNLSSRGIDITYLINGVNLNILNNTFDSISTGAIRINANSHSSGTTNIQNNIVSNVSTGGSYPAIEIDGLQHSAICNNNISDSASRTTYGIYEGSGSDYTSVGGNTITGMRLGEIYLIGSNSGPGVCAAAPNMDVPDSFFYSGSGNSGDSSSIGGNSGVQYYYPESAILGSNPFQYVEPALPAEEKELMDLFPDLEPVPETATNACTDIENSAGLVPCGRYINDPATSWNECDPCRICSVLPLASNVVNFLMRAIIILTVLALIVGGIIYMTAAGDSGRIMAAKQNLWNIMQGFVIVFISWVIINTLMILFGFNTFMGSGSWARFTCNF